VLENQEIPLPWEQYLEALGKFENDQVISYYDDITRTEKGLAPLCEEIGVGICPHCGQEIKIMSEQGVVGRDDKEARASNYIRKHLLKDEKRMCPVSQERFSFFLFTD
jgi:hypothetical protein